MLFVLFSEKMRRSLLSHGERKVYRFQEKSFINRFKSNFWEKFTKKTGKAYEYTVEIGWCEGLSYLTNDEFPGYRSSIALDYAVCSSQIGIMKFALKHGAEINHYHIDTTNQTDFLEGLLLLWKRNSQAVVKYINRGNAFHDLRCAYLICRLWKNWPAGYANADFLLSQGAIWSTLR